MSATDFIEMIGKYAVELCNGYDIVVVSPIIAQACLETGYGNSSLSNSNNFFGMKAGKAWNGKKVAKLTYEYIERKKVPEYSYFRAYDTPKEGVQGYFDFINTKRYSNLKGIINPEEYLELIIKDGYATDPSYVFKCLSIIKKNNLTEYDKKIQTNKELYTIAMETYNLKYGCGNERKNTLEKLGYDYNAVQEIVNLICIAKDVIDGKYGNGDTRKKALAAKGYDYERIQTIVNRMMK